MVYMRPLLRVLSLWCLVPGGEVAATGPAPDRGGRDAHSTGHHPSNEDPENRARLMDVLAVYSFV